MNYLQKIELIKETPDKSGYVEESQRIELLESGASVGSELLMSVTHELLILTRTNDKLKDLIGNETAELKKFCWSIGLYVN
jgi:hypothetical protein